jgi:hypothetical protein
MLFKHLKKSVAFSFYSSPLKLYFLKLTSLSVHVGYIHRFALSDTISVVFKYHARNKYCRGAPLLTNTCRYQQTCPYIQLSTKLKSVVVRKGLLYGRKYSVYNKALCKRCETAQNWRWWFILNMFRFTCLFLCNLLIYALDYNLLKIT